MTSIQIRHNQSTGPIANSDFVVYISGLPFSLGSTYKSRLGPTSISALGCVNFNTGGTTGLTTSFISGLV